MILIDIMVCVLRLCDDGDVVRERVGSYKTKLHSVTTGFLQGVHTRFYKWLTLNHYVKNVILDPNEGHKDGGLLWTPTTWGPQLKPLGHSSRVLWSCISARR